MGVYLFIFIKTYNKPLAAILLGREMSYCSSEAKNIRNFMPCFCSQDWEAWEHSLLDRQQSEAAKELEILEIWVS